MIKNFIFSSLLLLFISLFESAVLANIYSLTVIPDLLLITVIYLSYRNGSFFGETCGFLSGMLIDVLSAAPIGLNAFIRTVAGFVYGILKSSFFVDKFFFPFLLGFSATFLKVLLTFILSIFYRSGVLVPSLFSANLWIEAGENGFLTPLFFLLYDAFPGVLTVKKRLHDV